LNIQNIFDTKSEKKPAVLVPPNGEASPRAATQTAAVLNLSDVDANHKQKFEMV